MFSTDLDNNSIGCDAGEICNWSPTVLGNSRFLSLDENITVPRVEAFVIPQLNALSTQSKVDR